MPDSQSYIVQQMRRSSEIVQIARAVAWEKISKPRPTDLSRVPPNSEALTADYLTHALCAEVPGARVTAVTLGRASSGSSDRCAFTVTYNDAGRAAGLPTSLFNKCTKTFETRLHFLRCGINENEPRFYRIIRPQLDIEAPIPYYADTEQRSGRSVVITEDVTKTKGARFFEVADEVSKPAIDDMVGILAAFHGKFWDSPQLDQAFGWLKTPRQFYHRIIDSLSLKDNVLSGLQRAMGVVPAAHLGNASGIWGAYLHYIEEISRGPKVLLHGDPHIRNYYATHSGKMGLGDWQVTMKGAWSHDFAYTMITCLPIDSRRAWERDLLRSYLEKVGAAGGKPPAFDDAWEIYRRHAMHAYIGWLSTIGFGPLQPAMQPDDESLEIIRRASTAVDDLDTLRLLAD